MVRGRDPGAIELRAVAPILANGKLVAPGLVVANGPQVIVGASAELLRPHAGAALALATKLDGSATVPLSPWGMGRFAATGLLELAAPLGTGHDIVPLDLGAVCATVDTRGAPAAFVVIAATAHGFERVVLPVHIDNDDGAGMSDVVLRAASPIEAAHVGIPVLGAPLFAWFPANPALGRPEEVLAMGLGVPYRGHSKPRDLPVIADIGGLDDLGRALLAARQTEEKEPELKQVAGEIEDHVLPDVPAEDRYDDKK